MENVEPETKELKEALSSLSNGPVAILVFGNSSALAVAAKASLEGSSDGDNKKQAVALLFTWNPSFKINTRSTVSGGGARFKFPCSLGYFLGSHGAIGRGCRLSFCRTTEQQLHCQE